MHRTIFTRVLVAAIATGLVGATGATFASWLLGHRALAHRLAGILRTQYDEDAVRRCRTDPRWQLLVSPDARAYAYDETTLRSRNPDAPPLRMDLYAQLPPGDDQAALGFQHGHLGVAIVLRRRAAAPCGLIQLSSEPAVRPDDLVTGEVLGALVTGFVCCFLAALVVGVPLARRIHRLRRVAARIGEPGYASAAPPGGDELDELARALDAAHARIRTDAGLLEHQRNALERHLVEVAHDLRTPLTSLQAALERATEPASAAVRRELLAGALFDVVYLSALTDNLRLASQLRAGAGVGLDRTEVDLGELVERVAVRARMLARRRHVSLEMALPDAPLVVRAGAVAAEQALTNVVHNAVSYVDDGGRVAIVVQLDDERGAFTIDVRDDGPGVPPRELPRLGTAAFRSDDARQRAPRGMGIGLAITAEVCRRFDWTLSFQALEPRGLGVRIAGRCA